MFDKQLLRTYGFDIFSGCLVMITIVAHVSFVQSASAQEKHSEGWTQMFNGKDLAGWTQKNGTATYEVLDGEVEDGGIICGTTVEGSPNSFLCSDKLYANFELKFDVLVSNELNSGVQIRSKTNDPNQQERKNSLPGRVFGPQVEIEASGKSGALAGYVYGEATGRGWLTPENKRKKSKVFKDGEWNSYRIVAEGPRIRTWINGEAIDDLTDDDIYQTHDRGFIGLQVHGIGAGQGPFQVRWRKLRIRELNRSVQHSFLGFGKANGVVMVDESGAIVWQMKLPCSDGWLLENGNILVAIYPTEKFPKGGVAEIHPETKELVWSYQGQQSEISTVQQVGDNEYLVAELGAVPRAIVINREGKILSEMALQCQKENAHMQTRMLRKLANGNYIAPHLFDFAVKEYSPETGKVVRTIPTDDRGREKRDWPFTAIRLGNGNTLIGCTNGNRVIEVDADNNIVWSVDNEDLGEELIADACGVQRLANGNTVITSYYAKGDKVKLLEVTRDKKVVWRYSGMQAGFHHFQILTTNDIELSESKK